MKRNYEDVSLFSRQYNVRIEANKKLCGGYDRYYEEITDYDDYGALGSSKKEAYEIILI